MKTEKFEGSVSSAWGTPIKPSISFQGSYQAYETYEEIVAANDLPSHDEVLKLRNTERKQNQRQQAMIAALESAGYKKPTLEDEAVRVREMVKIFVAAGSSEEVALQKAKAALGIADTPTT